MYDYEYEAMYSLEDFYWWFVARRSLTVELLRDQISGLDSVRILDIGCGTGANMTAFAALGEITGIDPSNDALSFCHKRGIQTVVSTQVETMPFANRTFNVVTALDVLEHTDDDLLALREIQRVCDPSGILFITVPAYGFLWSEHDEALKHRRRYTAHELRNKLTVTGFEVVRTSYFISALFFPILGLRIWQGLRKNSTAPKTSLRVLPKWINTSLIRLLDLEQRLLRRINFPFGVSIVAMARPINR